MNITFKTFAYRFNYTTISNILRAATNIDLPFIPSVGMKLGKFKVASVEYLSNSEFCVSITLDVGTRSLDNLHTDPNEAYFPNHHFKSIEEQSGKLKEEIKNGFPFDSDWKFEITKT